ncbi:MAG TPA: efflux RND transporter periplasmic adaptor subunit [Bryobacteraceae bacterium]
MPAVLSCVRIGLFREASVTRAYAYGPVDGRPRKLAAMLLLAVLALLPTACGPKKEESQKAEQAKNLQPGLFTVSEDQRSHLRISPVRKASWSVTVHTTGTVDFDADHTTQAITQVNGPIARILVDTGSKVKAGDPLLYVSSPDVSTAISAYRKARNRENLAKRTVDRMKLLLDKGAIALKDYESAEADFNDAGTDVQNSLQSLKIFAITAQEIDQAEKQGVAISPELAVRAPITGTVVQKLVSPGQLIQAGTTLCFVLSDMSTVWVHGHIFDRDLAAVHLQDAVEETNPGFSRTFHGVVAYVGAMLDPTTRTTPVRIVTRNPDGLLKKDMFLDAVIHTSVQKNVLSVPLAAVLRDAQNEPFVYVEAEPGKFAQRPVTIGAQQDGWIEILTGLKGNENVVSDGSLFLQFATTYQ